MNIYNFLKNSLVFQNFLKSLRTKSASHAYMICSEDRAAVKAMAELFSSAFLCKSALKPCLVCNDCKRVFGNTHPDFAFFPKKNDKIYVADVDELIKNSAYRPTEGDVKVFFLDNGETMNFQSQNKLLKTLEEPPLGTHIIIATTNLENFLPTVLSRCVVVTIENFSAESIASFLKSSGLGGDNTDLISVTCGGRIGKAIEMSGGGDYLKMQAFAYSLLEKLKKPTDIIALVAESDMFPDKKELAAVLQVYLRDCLMVKTGIEAVVINKTELPALYKAAKLMYAEDFTYFIEKCNELRQKLLLNCNPSNALELLLLEMSQKIINN